MRSLPLRHPALLLLVLLAGCAGPRLERAEFRRPCMGIEARIVVYAPDEATARAAGDAAFARLAALEQTMSDWRDDSELSRLCALGAGTHAASDDLCRVLARAVEMGVATDGAFDCTVGPIVSLWRDARRTGRRPPPAALAAARARCGADGLRVDERAGTVTLARDGMDLDLGGIGKGFAADEALATLAAHGCTIALVDLGGDLAVGAPPPGTAGWRIAVDPQPRDARGAAPPDGAPAPHDVLLLAHAAIATSGDAYQFVEIDGVRHSHILDPRTGEPLVKRIAVTVRAADGATADALASALSVLGPADAERVLARFPGAAARFELGFGDGVLRTTAGAWE